MREPAKPRKPRKLVSKPQSRSSGGELVPNFEQPSQDVVPTAPAPAPIDWDDAAALAFSDVRAQRANAADRDAVDASDSDAWRRRDALPSSEASPGRDTSPRSHVPNAEELGHAHKPIEISIQPVKRGLKRVAQLPKSAWRWLRGLVERFKNRRKRPMSDIAQRRAEKKRDKVKRRTKFLAMGGGALAVLALAFWVVLGSPLFRYHYDPADIVGQTMIVDRARIEAAVSAYDGAQLVPLSTAKMAAEISAEVPELASVEVEKHYRSKLTVTVTEEIPVACVGSGDCVPVSASGKQLSVSADQLEGLPRIGKIGDKLDKEQAVAQALEILGALAPETRAAVQSIDIANGALVSMELTEGRTVFWGPPERTEFKAKVLGALLSQPAHHFDVSVPDAPVSK